MSSTAQPTRAVLFGLDPRALDLSPMFNEPPFCCIFFIVFMTLPTFIQRVTRLIVGIHRKSFKIFKQKTTHKFELYNFSLRTTGKVPVPGLFHEKEKTQV